MKTPKIRITLKRSKLGTPLDNYTITKIVGAVSVFSTAGNKERFVGDVLPAIDAKDLAAHYTVTTLP